MRVSRRVPSTEENTLVSCGAGALFPGLLLETGSRGTLPRLRLIGGVIDGRAALVAAAPYTSVALARSTSATTETVARPRFLLRRLASYARGDDPDDWQTAALNVPMTFGDRA